MKNRKYGLERIFIPFVFFAVCCGCSSRFSSADSTPKYESLVPCEAGISPTAWCTWGTQNRTLSIKKSTVDADNKIMFAGDQGASLARENINEKTVFSDGGWIDDWPQIRGDMFFLFDDGWDVKPHIDRNGEVYLFGSMILNAEKFPTCANPNPAERLRKLNDKVKARGWKGAGLWIAAQCARSFPNEKLPPNEVRQYWKTRILWSKEAGVKYWKVDWGYRCLDVDFRKMLTDLGHELYPDLLIEHSIPRYPINSLSFDKRNGRFTGSGRFVDTDIATLGRIKKLLKFSDYTRVYDTIAPFTTVSTLDRTYWYLTESEKIESNGILNIEDDVYLGAGLGCAYAIMRSNRWSSGTPHTLLLNKKCAEVIRAVRWQRIAPAFSTANSKTLASQKRLEDSWTFKDGQTWWKEAWGQKLHQSAPAIVARNMKLPYVVSSVKSDADIPFIAASKSPNGAVAVAFLPRVGDIRGVYTPKVSLCVEENISGKKVGVFGYFDSISFKVAAKPRLVLAQDLLSDNPVDITSECEYRDGWIILSGRIAEKLCSIQPKGDISAPAIVFKAE